MFNNIAEAESFICRMIDKLDTARTDILELDTGSIRIRLGRSQGTVSDALPICKTVPAVQMAAASAEAVDTAANIPPATSALHSVTAPLIGVAYAAASPDSAPFVKVGDKIKKGDIILIIEAMKVMNEIESDRDGEVVEILFENGKMVEFGAELIRLK